MYWATEQDLHFWIIVAQYHNYFAPLLAEINLLHNCSPSTRWRYQPPATIK
jgi:hypothetical protein